MSEKSKISLDLTADMVFEPAATSDGFAQLYKVSTTFDYQLAKWVSIFAGPSFNVNVMQFKDVEGIYTSSAVFKPFYSEQFTNAGLQCWIGGQVGFRF